MPRVSVNIVTWNSAGCILRCLEHVFQQTYTDFGVLVIDNASQDDTAGLVEAHYPADVRIIRSAENLGFAKAHNLGIRETDGELVFLLNPDVFLTPTYLEHMVRAFDASTDPRLGSAAGRLLQIPEMPGPALPPERECLIDSTGLVMRKSRRQYLRGYRQPAAGAFEEPAAIFGPDGAAPVYRRAMLEDAAVEGEVFDELFVTHKEDVDLAWRAQLLGWNSVYVPGAVAYHVRGFRPGDRSRVSEEVRRVAVRNRWLMMVKNDLPGLFIRHLPYILPYEVGILGYILLRERQSLAAYADFFKYLPAMRRRRHVIQQRRQRSAREMARWFTTR